ncbi:MAG TPA: glycosyltransferase family 2 protein [Acidimicrobiales bacterium]|nr:glycosyltransferase family 2 protein [Acidimicrobiales bacterium]
MQHAASSVAIAIPAYNEAEGIASFLHEIDEALHGHVDDVTFVVADDCSTDDTVEVLEALRPRLRADLVVESTGTNCGHGPAALAAYRRALDTGADHVIGVDGDGQFLGTDIRRVLVLLEDGGDGVCGVRRFRYDPWFRMSMTRLLRVYIHRVFGVPTRDANCPLRGYRAPLLDELLRWIPDGSLIPNVHLTILAARRGATLVEVDVNHRVRRGESNTGTMFASAGTIGVLKRLASFSVKALAESWRFRHDLNSGRRPMLDARHESHLRAA